MNHRLGLHHELTLLALNDSTGKFESTMLTYGLAGAIFSELILEDRIATRDDEKKTVELKSDKRFEDELLNEVLESIRASASPQGMEKWISKTASIKGLKNRVRNNCRNSESWNPRRRKYCGSFPEEFFRNWMGATKTRFVNEWPV